MTLLFKTHLVRLQSFCQRNSQPPRSITSPLPEPQQFFWSEIPVQRSFAIWKIQGKSGNPWSTCQDYDVSFLLSLQLSTHRFWCLLKFGSQKNISQIQHQSAEKLFLKRLPSGSEDSDPYRSKQRHKKRYVLHSTQSKGSRQVTSSY